jgi:putative transposase
MDRRQREEMAGGVFHVSARGNNRERLFFDDADFERYLKLLAWVVGLTGWRCLAYCLMPNHVHLQIETPVPNLGVGMQRLQGTYAKKLNARHGRCGHVFQGRYDAVRVKDDPQFWVATKYVARNPVKAGLCERPEDWRWSSDRAVVTRSWPEWLDVRRLLELLSGAGGDPLERYVELTRQR